MGKIAQLLKHLQGITIAQQEAALLQIIKDNEHVAVDLNTSQLMAGRDSKGRSLGEYKSMLYAEFKKTLNPAGVVDLKLSGDFHSDFFIDTHQFPVVFDSRNWKTGKLVDVYGEDLFGTDEENTNTLVQGTLKFPVIEYYKSKVFHV
jgi:hypothetical protein